MEELTSGDYRASDKGHQRDVADNFSRSRKLLEITRVIYQLAHSISCELPRRLCFNPKAKHLKIWADAFLKRALIELSTNHRCDDANKKTTQRHH